MPQRRKRQEDEVLGSIFGLAKQLSCGIRVELIVLLMRGPREVTSLADILELGLTTVSGHLTTLAKAGFVSCEAEGRWRIYSLTPLTQIVVAGPVVMISLTSTSEALCMLQVPRTALDRLLRLGGTTATPTLGAHATVVTRPAADRALRGSGPSASRPPTAP